MKSLQNYAIPLDEAHLGIQIAGTVRILAAMVRKGQLHLCALKDDTIDIRTETYRLLGNGDILDGDSDFEFVCVAFDKSGMGYMLYRLTPRKREVRDGK